MSKFTNLYKKLFVKYKQYISDIILDKNETKFMY